MGHAPGLPDASGFAVPMDVENHPVREVDRARHRGMWRVVLGVGVFVAGLLLLAWQHYEFTAIGYRLGELNAAAAREERIHRDLLLEQAALRSLQRIEAIAINELHMVAPTQTEAVVIERIRQAAAPAKTLVARRE